MVRAKAGRNGRGDPLSAAADHERAAEEKIKRHLARELHDRVAQSLTAMIVQMENFKHTQQGRQGVIAELAAFQDSTREVLINVRDLVYDLRGESGIDGDFLRVIQTGLLRRFQERTGIVVKLSVTAWPRRLPTRATVNLYRILQEALNNVRLHSGASMVTITLAQTRDGGAAMTVIDDGRGIEVQDTERSGMGLLGIRERALLLGGSAEITKGGDRGTTVQVVFPRQR